MTRTCTSLTQSHTGNGMYFNSKYNFFVEPYFIIAAHVGYIVTILGLKQIMKSSKEINCDIPMKLYNLIQVVLSAVMTIALAPNLTVNLLNTPFCADIEFWVFVHYLSKFLDMFDSVWMVLRKKDNQLSFLHVYHHLTIGAIWGFLLHAGLGNGTAFYGAWVNSAVHALMYFHYLVTSFGINNPFKKYLTQIQMTQFASCILHAVCVVVLTDFPKNWGVLQLTYHFTLLALFMNFYSKQFNTAKKTRTSKTE